MEKTNCKAREAKGNLVGGSNLTPSPIEIGDSNDGDIEIQISKESGFDFGFHEEEEVKKQGQFEDFDMFFEDKVSSGSQRSTSKPK